LDFILKIIDVFPEVDLYWILNGKGSFPKNNEKKEKLLEEVIKPISPTLSNNSEIQENLFSEIQNTIQADSKKIEKQNSINEPISSEIEKIVLFYKNGTFKVYQPT
jgi:hypothetical protein